jgi:ligand-binding sensor domain-containing protein
MKNLFFLSIILIVFLASFLSAENFLNFSSTITVNDIEQKGNNLFVASSGGLYVYNLENNTGNLLPSDNNSPDPNITSLCFENDNSLWYGTNNGFLVNRKLPLETGSVVCYRNYFSSKWKILDLVKYDKYLIIASNKGISVFNTEAGYAEKNATKIGNFSTSQINTIRIYNDILYCGLNTGVATLSLKNGISKINFFDPSIWLVNDTTTMQVKSFSVVNNRITPFNGSSENVSGIIFRTSDSTIFKDTSKAITLPSEITCMKYHNGDEFWVGTADHYFYKWNSRELIQYQIPGPTQQTVNRIFVDNSGKVWYLPQVEGQNPPWWIGIEAFEKNAWKLYNKQNYPEIGVLNDNPLNRAIHQTKDGRIWFGTSGGQIKTYTPATDSWKIFHVNSNDNKRFYVKNYSEGWGKTDAFAQDSSGYFWISRWHNDGGSLLCYDSKYDPDDSQTDPLKAHFTAIYPGRNYNFTMLHVDNEGKILAGNEDDGNIFVLKHNGNPLGSGIQTIANYTIPNATILDAVNIYDKEPTQQDVFHSSKDPIQQILHRNYVLIATTNGLYKYSDTTFYSRFGYSFKKLEEFGTNITSIEKENDNIFWISTDGDGLMRYDVSSNQIQAITTAHGLISNSINWLSIDKKNGYLWIGTDIGVSRMDIGYSISNMPDVSDIEIYPNPVSLSKMRNSTVSIRNVPIGGTISIYSADGQLVAKPKELRKENAALYVWNISPELAPGIYVVMIRNGKQSGMKRIMITP